MPRISLLLLTFISLTAVGCYSGSGPNLQEVSGNISKDGVPFVDANLEFYPESGGAPSYGKSDEQGNFKLYYSTGAPGAVPGKHSVTILGGKKADAKQAEKPVSAEMPAQQPKEYKGKEVTAEISEDNDNHVVIEL